MEEMAIKLDGRKEKARQCEGTVKRVKSLGWRRKWKGVNGHSLIKGKRVTRVTQPTEQFYLETRTVDPLILNGGK